MNSIKGTLIGRDGLSPVACDALIYKAGKALMCYLEAGNIGAIEEICYEFFNLGPEYLGDLCRIVDIPYVVEEDTKSQVEGGGKSDN